MCTRSAVGAVRGVHVFSWPPLRNPYVGREEHAKKRALPPDVIYETVQTDVPQKRCLMAALLWRVNDGMHVKFAC